MIFGAPHATPHTRHQRVASGYRVPGRFGTVLIALGIAITFSSLGALASPPSTVYQQPESSRIGDIATIPIPPVTSPERFERAIIPAPDSAEREMHAGAVEHQPFALPHESPVTDQPLRRRGEGLDEGNSLVAATVATDEVSQPPTAVPTAIEMPPPVHIAIPNVGIDTPVIEVSATAVGVDGRTVFMWQVADWAAGHHSTSANPGENGNIVIAGHVDVRGEVFRNLQQVVVGDEVTLTSAAGTFLYVVEEIHLREYTEASLDEQIAAGVFLGPMDGERLTLVTCWPYQVDTHRLIVVAKPRR